jgi:L-lactate dehydrogenase complex protein LldG
MSAARDEILARVRAATVSAAGRAATPGGTDAAYAAIARGYQRAHHDPAATDIVALFAERAADYRAVVERVPDDALPAAIARALTSSADVASTDISDISRSVLVPAGLPDIWLTELTHSVTLVRDDPPLTTQALDKVFGAVTGCAVAIAETGTIILDHGPDQGRRALTLVPDFHLVIVLASQIAPDIADALSRLDPSRPHTLISGPSATSDIELIRVEGVHGPRNLHVLVAG